MKKRVALFAAVALLLGGFSVYNVVKPADMEVASGDAAFEKYSSIDDLEKSSDLVVVAKFTGDRELYVRNDDDGTPIVKLTKSTVKIEKVLKGDAQNKDEITVFEDCYISENDRFVTTEHYKWMNKNGKYLLFLYSQPLNDTYVISSLYQGKYDLNLKQKAVEHKDSKKALADPEVEYMGHDSEFEDFYKMKGQAIKKYGL